MVSLIERIDATCFRHSVAVMRDGGPLAARLPDHAGCWSLGLRGRTLSGGFRVGRIARKWRAGVIHARNMGCWMDALVAGWCAPRAQVVLGFHGFDRPGGLTARQRRIAKWALRCGARFTSVSEAGRRLLEREAGIPVHRIRTLDNGVDLDRFKPAAVERKSEVRRRLNLLGDAFVIGTVGSLTAVKRPDLMIEIARRLCGRYAECHVLLVGDGPLMADLQGQIRAWGLNGRVHLLGGREDIPDVLAAMDVFVCPSDSEGMSNALLEALAAGLPVVSTDVGDHARVLGDGRAGIIVPPGDADALSHAVEALRLGPDRPAEYAVEARHRAADFDFARTVEAYERYYSSLIVAPASNRRHRLETCAPYGWKPMLADPNR